MKQLFLILILLVSFCNFANARGRSTRFGVVQTEQAVTSSGGTTTLLATGASVIRVSGSASHTIVLPDATGLPQYTEKTVINDSTGGTVDVQDNGGTSIQPIAIGSYLRYRLTDNSDANGTWKYLSRGTSAIDLDNGSISGTLGISNGGTNLSAVGNANELLGTNSSADSLEYKAAVVTSTGAASFPQAIVAQKSLLLQDPDGGSATITLEAQASQSSAYAIGFPPTASINGYVLKTNGSGLTSWGKDIGFDISGNASEIIGMNDSGTEPETKSATVTSSGSASFPQAIVAQKSLLLQDPDGGSATITLQAQASQSAAYAIGFPPTAGVSGYVLKTDGTGGTSWSADSELSLTGSSNEMIGLDSAGTAFETKTATLTSTGAASFPQAIIAQKSLLLQDPDGGAATITIEAQASQSSAYALALPPDAGVDGHILKTDGTGQLSWIAQAAGSIPSGSANQLIGLDATASVEEAKNVTADSSGNIVADGYLQSNTSLVLEEPDAGTTTVTIQAAASQTVGYVLTLPPDDGNAREFLTTDGSGNLSFSEEGAYGIKAICASRVNYAGGIPYAAESTNDCVASISDDTTGEGTVTFSTGYFSKPPTCTCTTGRGGGQPGANCGDDSSLASATTWLFHADISGTSTDLNIDFICVENR